MRFEGRKALVTGGGSGIGAAIVERLAAEGASARRAQPFTRVAFLAAGESSYVTGETLGVSGGMGMV